MYDILDEADRNLLPANYNTPSFLAGNVVKTWNENTTTYYSYDVYGRVKWIVQQISGLPGFKTIDYVYDPVTSQVTKVYYQKGASDQFIHRYMYDPADYSITKVETSVNDVNYTEHATYDYYETGALKRINIAQGLQGMDYVYNLQGALKSINHPSLSQANDPGGDTNDLFGMMIDYHDYDYNRPLRNIKSAAYGINQYNGNIKGIRWNSDYNPIQGKEHTYSYAYNRNNWLQGANYGYFTGDYTSIPTISEGEEGTADQDHITTTDVVNSGTTKNYLANVSVVMAPGFHAGSGSNVSAKISGSGAVHDVNAGTLVTDTHGDYKVDNITYDANGNIQTLDRNKHTENGSNAMDRLSYTYDIANNKPNQLKQVTDSAGDVTGADDIGSQTNPDNYVYNKIGQLVHNRSENITYLYNASGLVTEVQKNNQPLVKFFYNDKGHRVRKESYNPTTQGLTYTEHYVRDAAGTAMAIYRDGQVIENTIYGSDRLGVRKSDGTHLYQLTDHLGNVRAVVGRNAQGQPMAITSATDYYPFGMPMPGRNLQGDYRYAYQGQEKDPETGKEAFELRLWDSRIGRWLTTDPAKQYSSPYLGMGNNPINGIDPDGAKYLWKPDKNGNLIAEAGDNANTLATFLNISEMEAASMIESQKLLPGNYIETNSPVAPGQILKLDNVFTRALSNSNGTLTTDKLLDAFETGNRDFIIGSNDRYNCFGCSLSGTQGIEINNQTSLMTDPFSMERKLNNIYQEVGSENAIFGKTIISFSPGGLISHAAVFYGRSNDGTAYVFTKNGTKVTPEIMPLNALITKLNSTILPVHERYGKVTGYYNFID